MSTFPDRLGLQPERTALAWQRTTVSVNAVSVSLVVVGGRLGSWPLTVLSTATVILVGVLAVGARRRFDPLRDDPRGTSPFGPMLRAAGATVLTGLSGAVTGFCVWLS